MGCVNLYPVETSILCSFGGFNPQVFKFLNFPDLQGTG